MAVVQASPPPAPPASTVLQQVYEALDGANWINSEGWRPGLSCDVPHQHRWHGTDCSGGAITRLELLANNLQGTLPTELGLLANLRSLAIESNPLLSGSIPTQLAALRELTFLSVHNSTRLSGTLPNELGSLDSLSYLSLHECALSGTLPDNAVMWSNLRHFSMASNAISGYIPAPRALEHVGLLNIHSNRLSGTLPTEIGLLSTLHDRLYAHTNQLSGTLPSQVGLLTHVSLPALYGNWFSGTLPTELGKFDHLVFPALSYNRLSGTTPAELGNWKSLQARLDIASNNMADTDGQAYIDAGIAQSNLPKTWFDHWARCDFKSDPRGRFRCSISAA